MSKIYRIIAEQFEFKVKFFTDLGGHPRTSMTPRSVITLRGRRAIDCFLLLYESCLSTLACRGASGKPGERAQLTITSGKYKWQAPVGVKPAAPHPSGRGSGKCAAAPILFNFSAFEAETLAFARRIEDSSRSATLKNDSSNLHVFNQK